MRKEHVWGYPPCVRQRRHRDFNGEAHPCYWCGRPMPVNIEAKTCDKCHGMVCPFCGKCMCNVTDGEYEALRILRRRYCINSWHFRGGMEQQDLLLLRLVPNFQTALDYCRRLEGCRV